MVYSFSLPVYICVFLSFPMHTFRNRLFLNVEVKEVIRTEPIASHWHTTAVDGGNQFPRVQQISNSLAWTEKGWDWVKTGKSMCPFLFLWDLKHTPAHLRHISSRCASRCVVKMLIWNTPRQYLLRHNLMTDTSNVFVKSLFISTVDVLELCW